MFRRPMTTPAPHPQSSAALRLLLWGELAVLVHQVLLLPVQSLYAMSLRPEAQELRTFVHGYGLLSLLPLILVAAGLVRFAAPLDVTVRRWAWATVILLGLREAIYLVSMALPVPEHGRSAGQVAAGVLISLMAAGITLTTLLAVWKGCLALGARAPRRFFLAIAGLAAVVLVGQQVRLLVDLSPRAAASVGIALHGLTLATLALRAGAIFLARAALLSTQETHPEAAEWKAAAHGLTLWLWAAYGSLVAGALAIVAIALTRLMNPVNLLLLLLALPVSLMGVGLFHYARVPEASGARAPAQAAAGVLVFVFASVPSLLSPDLMRHLRRLDVDGLPFIVQILIQGINLVGIAFFIQSLRRAVPSQAERTAHIGTVLLVSNGAGAVLRPFVEATGPLRILSFLVALVATVYAVRFLILVHGLRSELVQDLTAPPQAPSLFSQT